MASSEPMLLKIAIPLYSLLLFLAVAAKKRMVQKKIGKNPILFSGAQSGIESYLKKLALLFFPIWLGGMNLFAYDPGLWEKFPHLNWPDGLRIAGVGLLFASWGLFATSLFHLKESWRIGIDWETSPKLVSNGVYRLIRHPIYTSLKLALVATLIIFPNFYFLWIGTAAYIGFTVIALLEEDFLKERLGEKYEDYMKRTSRFYPRLF